MNQVNENVMMHSVHCFFHFFDIFSIIYLRLFLSHVDSTLFQHSLNFRFLLPLFTLYKFYFNFSVSFHCSAYFATGLSLFSMNLNLHHHKFAQSINAVFIFISRSIFKLILIIQTIFTRFFLSFFLIVCSVHCLRCCSP